MSMLSSPALFNNQSLAALVLRLQAAFGADILDLRVFGSTARGEARRDSDIDVFVLVREETWPIEDKILRLGARVSLDYDVLFNLYVIGQERWQFMKENGYPLAQNIEREGIALTSERAIYE